MDLKEKIRDIEDFPKKGVVFKDITTLLKDKEAFNYVIKKMADLFREKEVDVVVGPESRGFIFGAPLAYELGVGFVPVRKKGKLPHDCLTKNYGTEYSQDCIEIHKDSINPGQNVLIVDDLLATGGTISAVIEMIEELGGNVLGPLFLIELSFLEGKNKIQKYDYVSLLKY